MEKRFFLDRIALDRGEIAVRHIQRAVAVEPYATDAVAAGGDQATMTAGITTHFPVRQLFVQLAFDRQGG